MPALRQLPLVVHMVLLEKASASLKKWQLYMSFEFYAVTVLKY